MEIEFLLLLKCIIIIIVFNGLLQDCIFSCKFWSMFNRNKCVLNTKKKKKKEKKKPLHFVAAAQLGLVYHVHLGHVALGHCGLAHNFNLILADRAWDSDVPVALEMYMYVLGLDALSFAVLG